MANFRWTKQANEFRALLDNGSSDPDAIWASLKEKRTQSYRKQGYRDSEVRKLIQKDEALFAQVCFFRGIKRGENT